MPIRDQLAAFDEGWPPGILEEGVRRMFRFNIEIGYLEYDPRNDRFVSIGTRRQPAREAA